MSELSKVAARTRVLDLPDDFDRAFQVLRALRKNLDFDEFKRFVKLAQAADGYKLVGREIEGRLVAILGYRILHDLAHGSHLYIDDLVTLAEVRSANHGAELLRFAESEARRLGLNGLRLCGVDADEDARKFFEREGWTQQSFSFRKSVAAH